MLLLAGEASGDEHGAALAAAIRTRRPDVRFVGTGGPAMQSEGVELLAGLEDLAVMGFAEVLPRAGAGLLVPAGDAAGLAKGIVEVLGEWDAHHRAALASRANIEAAYSWPAIAGRTEEVYRRIT